MKKQLYIFLLFAGFLLVFNLGSWGLTESSEARYATIAKEMYQSGNYVSPTLLGIKHLHKPPLTYYITTLGYSIFGINEFAARFFMQIALLIQLLLVYKISLLLFKNKKLAFASSLIYFSIPLAIIAVRNLTTDAYLTTFILATIFFWLKYKTNSKNYWLLLFYASLGLAFETKGPVGLVVPLTFAISYTILYKHKFKNLKYHLLGFLIFIAISASWFLFVINQNDGLLDYFFNNQFVERIAENKFKRGKPIWYYLALLPAVTLPWFFIIIPFLKRKKLNNIKQNKAVFILLITFAVLFFILSITTSKLVLYILPLTFIVAIIVALALKKSSLKTRKILNYAYYALITLVCLGMLVVKFIDKTIITNTGYVLIVTVVILSSIIIINKQLKTDNYLKTAFLGVVFSSSLLLFSTHFFSSNEILINSTKPIANFIAKENKNSHVIVYNYLLPSLSFYLNKPIKTINHGKYTTQRETQFETDLSWKEDLFNYYDEADRNRVLNLIKEDIIIIKRKKDVLPDTLLMMQKHLIHSKDFGKFTVYY